jgi:hypothetical protein
VLNGVFANAAIAPLVFSVPTGNYATPQNVAITTTTAGATIHYTTNGVDPTASDPVLATGNTVLVDHGLTLKARAWATGLIPSSVSTATYTLGTMVTANVVWTNAVGVQVTGNNLAQARGAGRLEYAGAVSVAGDRVAGRLRGVHGDGDQRPTGCAG